MTDAIGYWMNQAGRYSLLSAEETAEAVRELQAKHTSPARCRELLDKVTLANLRLVVRVVKQYTNNSQTRWSNDETADLLQQGYMGLRKAVVKFDPDKGYRFATYAGNWIRQSVARFRVQYLPLIRVPEKVAYDVYSTHRTGRMRLSKTGAATLQQLSDATSALAVKSYDAKVPGHETTLLDLIEDSVIEEEPAVDQRLIDFHDLLEQSGFDEITKDLMRAYLRRGSVRSAGLVCKVSEPKARRIIRQATKELKSMV